MKKTFKGYLLGFLSAVVLVSGVTYAANTTTLYDVIANGIKIVIDGQKINPTDANGNTVEPIIYNGTTYLPVRAVANAFGKSVYWDGPNYTVYLGDMDGKLEYPTEELSTEGNIGDWWGNSGTLKDNIGNTYSRGVFSNNSNCIFEKILNMKYSKFKGTIYVADGTTNNNTFQFVVKTDGKTVYTSPEITKTSKPVDFDIDVTGCYDFEMVIGDGVSWQDASWINIGNAGFYQ